jgi:hypothetical protein
MFDDIKNIIYNAAIQYCITKGSVKKMNLSIKIDMMKIWILINL